MKKIVALVSLVAALGFTSNAAASTQALRFNNAQYKAVKGLFFKVVRQTNGSTPACRLGRNRTIVACVAAYPGGTIGLGVVRSGACGIRFIQLLNGAQFGGVKHNNHFFCSAPSA